MNMHSKSTDITNRLWQFVQGNSDPELDEHMPTCPECQKEAETLRGLFALRTVEQSPAVPAVLTSSLSGLLTKVRPDLVQRGKGTHSLGQQIKTIVANLLQDTGLQPGIVGLRGQSRTRQIAFTSDVADLDLEVSPQDDQFLIVGQLGMDEVPGDLRIRFVPADTDPLSADNEHGESAAISNQGHFRLNVSPGAWVITVKIDDAVVMFPGFEL